MVDGEGVLVITRTTGDFERVCQIGAYVFDRWNLYVGCCAADRTRWRGQVEANTEDSIPVVVAIAILARKLGVGDSDLLIGCPGFQRGSGDEGSSAEGKDSEDLGKHFELERDRN